MRLRWLLLAIVTMSLVPSLASARSFHPPRIELEEPAPSYTIGAAIEHGMHAGKLVLAFYNTSGKPLELPIRVVADTIQYDWLTVELSSATHTRTLRFVEDRDRSATQTVVIAPGGMHFETIDLDPKTQDLPPGEYTVRITWDGQLTQTSTTTEAFMPPLHCGLTYASYALMTAPRSPSKLPYVLGGLAIASLLVGLLLQKRAGTADVRVPCSAL
jgi:hypothetical protein